MRSIIVIAVLAGLSSSAFADGDPPEPVSEHVALVLSLGGTAVSWGLVVASAKLDGEMPASSVGTIGTIGLVGTFLAPSAGHWYADKFLTRGFKARALGALSATAGVLMIAGDCIGEHASCSSGPVGGAVILLGLGLYAYGTLHDIATAPGRARARNRAVQSLVVAPLLHSTTTGLALGGTF